MNGSDEIDLRWIFKVISRWLWLIIGCAILAGALAYVVTTRMTYKYKATATLYIESARDTKTSEYNVLIAGERLAQTYSQMVKEPPVLAAVIDKLGLKKTPSGLAGMVTAAPVPNTQFIRLTVQDTDPQRAALIANTLAEALVNQVRNLQNDRYINALISSQKSLEELSARIEETQAKIDTLRTKKFEGEAELTKQQNLLSEYGNEYRTTQQSYQDLLLTINQERNKINIVEAAHVPTDQVRAPYTARVTFMLLDERLALTYGEILTGRPVLESAIQKLSLQTTPEELGKNIFANPIRDTQLIQLSVTNDDPGQATRLAEAIANAFLVKVQMLLAEPYTVQADDLLDQTHEISTKIEQTQAEIENLTSQNIKADSELVRLENLFSEDRSDYQVRQSDYEQLQFSASQAADAIMLSSSAQVPQRPDQNRMLYITLAALVGLIIGAVAAFLLEYLDDTVKTSEDITQKLGLTTIGVIDMISKADRGILVSDQPRSPSAEDFRALATNIRYASLDKPIRTLLITSPLPSDGKTMIAANLASAIAQGESSVVIVDADLRLPTLHKRFEVEQLQGLTESLLQNSIDGNLRPSRLERLNILTSGKLPPNPSEVVASDRMRHLITELSQKVDKVVLDSPPILVTADAKTLATNVDGVLLIVRAGQTTYQALREAVESLHQVNANLIGIVLNGVRQRKKGYYSYRYQETRRTTKRFFWQGWLGNIKKTTRSAQPEHRKPSRIAQQRREDKTEFVPGEPWPEGRKPGRISWKGWLENILNTTRSKQAESRKPARTPREERVIKAEVTSSQSQSESEGPGRIPQEMGVIKAEVISSQSQPGIEEPTRIPAEEEVIKAEVISSQPQPDSEEPTRIPAEEEVIKAEVAPSQPQPEVRKPGRISRKKRTVKAEITPSQPQPESEEPTRIPEDEEVIKVEVAPSQPQPESGEPGLIPQEEKIIKTEVPPSQPQPGSEEPTRIPEEEEVIKAEIVPSQPQPDGRKPGRISRKKRTVKAEITPNQPLPVSEEPTRIPEEEEVIKAEVVPSQPQPESGKPSRISRRKYAGQNRQPARPAKTR